MNVQPGGKSGSLQRWAECSANLFLSDFPVEYAHTRGLEGVLSRLGGEHTTWEDISWDSFGELKLEVLDWDIFKAMSREMPSDIESSERS